MPIEPDRAKAFLRSLTPEWIEEGNRRDHAEHERQVSEFREAYAAGRCYLCGDPSPRHLAKLFGIRLGRKTGLR